MKLKQGDFIRIDWIDAGGAGGWTSHHKYEPPRIVTIGHYIKEDRQGIYTAPSIDRNDFEYVLGLDFIPKGCIKRVRRLK